MSYELLVDDKFVSGGTWVCGTDVVNSGVSSASGKVQLRLDQQASSEQSWAVVYLTAE